MGDYIRIAGPPSYVNKYSDLVLLGMLLEPYGMKLVRPPLGLDRLIGNIKVEPARKGQFQNSLTLP